jgi:GntR family transcriptional repressor for pyruvate dehydrogenase complex
MASREVRNRSLSDQVFEQLVSEIVSGRLRAGEALPAERSLAALLNVNRHVVREAIRRLEQVGMVRVAQGGSTRVLDYHKHGGLDLLALLAGHARGGSENARIWLSVLEMRVAIGADMARLCALRADRALRDELVQISREMSEAADDDRALYALEVRFWDRLIDGADNLVGRLALNSMFKASASIGEAAQHWSACELRADQFRRPLADAIARGDADAAERLTRQALRAVADAFEAKLAAPTAHVAEGASDPARAAAQPRSEARERDAG